MYINKKFKNLCVLHIIATRTPTYKYKYIYMYVCVCVCEREREGYKIDYSYVNAIDFVTQFFVFYVTYNISLDKL
jgi:hypothetical protein